MPRRRRWPRGYKQVSGGRVSSQISNMGQAVNPDKAARVLATFREYMLGPTRFMNLLSCFELGIVDVLKAHIHSRLTAPQIGERVGAAPAAVEQLLHLLVKEDLLSYDEASSSYA